MSITVEVNESGALFDGRAAAAFHAYAEHLQDVLADELIDKIRAHLRGVLRVDHHVYESWIHAEHVGDHIEVTDRWVVYGPWLEGDGSRDAPRTRFPGYHTFRIVSDQFQAVVPGIAARELPPYVAEANA